ncbi:MAG: tetratricopeptide repeat protein [Pseudomonadota bacterium]|nr:tetratricopeptide repeat protein [Pseudomonadota bacterium]
MRLKRTLALAIFAAAFAGCATPQPETSVAGDYLAGRLAARLNAVGDAASAYAEASRIAPADAGILRDAFFFHLAAGDIDGAAPYAERIVGLGAGSGDEIEDLEAQEAEGLARLMLSARALKAGDLKSARALLAAPAEAPFVRSIGFLSEAWIESELAGPERAIAMLDSPGADVFNGFNPLHRALLAEKAGRLDEARAAYQTAIFSLGGPVGRAAYGAFLERHGDEADARAYYDVLARDPGPSRRAAEAANERLDRGRPSPAFSKMTATKGAAIAYYSFAGAMIEQAADQRARAEQAGYVIGEPRFNLPLSLARVALYLDPDLEDARRLVGVILAIYGDHDGASKVLSEIPPSSPHYEQSRIEMASGLVVRKRADEAIALLKDAIRRDRNGVELRWTLANVYASEGQHEQAVKTLDGVLDRQRDEPLPDAWRYYVTRGGSLLELGRWPEAEKDLKRAVELAPEQATALNYLGYSWAERGVNLDEAFALIEKAVALEPQSGAIIDSLGWAHYQRGDYKEAVGHLEKAASLEPEDATITDHLGDVYWRLGRRVEARYQWKRALELEPSEKLKSALEEKLEDGLKDDNKDVKEAA